MSEEVSVGRVAGSEHLVLVSVKNPQLINAGDRAFVQIGITQEQASVLLEKLLLEHLAAVPLPEYE